MVSVTEHGAVGALLVVVFLVPLCAGQAVEPCEQGELKPTFDDNCGELIKKYNKRCSALWGHFREAFCMKDDRDVTKTDYNGYADAASHELERDKATLYSGLRENGIREEYISISRTMLGGPMNGTHWKADQKRGYVIQDRVRSNTEKMFWRRVSDKYATLTKGVVRVLLDGTREHAFINHTIFADEELPNLNKSIVSLVSVFVVAVKGEDLKERCDEGSLRTLKRLITETYGLKYKCTDDQEEARDIFCSTRRKRDISCSPDYCDCWTRAPDIMTTDQTSTAGKALSMASLCQIGIYVIITSLFT